MQRAANLAGYAVLAGVLASPLLLGAVAPWAWASLAVWVGCAGMIFFVAQAFSPSPQIDPIHFVSPVTLVLCAVAVIWAWVQFSVSWPVAMHPVREAAQNIVAGVQPVIAINPDAALQIWLRWLMYAVVFVVAWVWGRDAVRARRALNAIVVAGTVYAAYGLMVFFMGSDMALWVHKPMYQLDVTGPFINKNNFAAYAGVVLCAALGLLIRRVVRDTSGTRGAEFWRRAMLCLLGRGAWLLVSVTVLFSALLLSHSRGGLISFVVALCVLMGLLRAARILRGRVFYWGTALLSAVLVALFFLSGAGVFERMVSDGEPARPQLYELAINAMADRPWLGHGLGSFPEVFQIYRTEDMPPAFFTERAHSVYLETILELGIPAALCLFLGVGWMMWQMAACVRLAARHRTIPAICAAAAVMLCAHSMMDFPLQIPAISILFAFLLGLGTARANG